MAIYFGLTARHTRTELVRQKANNFDSFFIDTAFGKWLDAGKESYFGGHRVYLNLSSFLMGQPRPLISFIFGLSQTNNITIFTLNVCEKMSIQYMGP